MISRSHLAIGLSISTLMFTLVLSSVVFAQETAISQQTEDQKQQLSQRLEKRKAEFKTRLTTTQQKRIQFRCKAAQVKLNGALTSATAIETNRTKIHDKLIKRLGEVEIKLNASNMDTTELKAQITVLQSKVDTYRADTTAYKQALSDTKDVDCTTDPIAFKASLEAARGSLTKLRADAADIRTHVNDTIKPILVALKTQLAATKEGDN